jgi:hypothetical protein
VSQTPTKDFALPLLTVFLSEFSLAITKLANILWVLEKIVLLIKSAIPELAPMELAKDLLTDKLA